MSQFKNEYVQDDLISVPCLKIQNYKAVPHHVTEFDIRTNIEKEEDEILQDRKTKVSAKKVDVTQALDNWGFQNATCNSAAEKLNDILFQYLFVGLDKAYPQTCQCPDCS